MSALVGHKKHVLYKYAAESIVNYFMITHSSTMILVRKQQRIKMFLLYLENRSVMFFFFFTLAFDDTRVDKTRIHTTQEQKIKANKDVSHL